MKTLTQIGQEIRSSGAKIGQTKLMARLAEFEPAFRNGRTVLYTEDDANKLISELRLKTENPKQSEPTQLDRIESMLSILCKELGVDHE